MLVYLVIKLICAWRSRGGPTGERRPGGTAGTPKEAKVAWRGLRHTGGAVGVPEGPEVAWRGRRPPGGARGVPEGPEVAWRQPEGT